MKYRGGPTPKAIRFNYAKDAIAGATHSPGPTTGAFPSQFKSLYGAYGDTKSFLPSIRRPEPGGRDSRIESASSERSKVSGRSLTYSELIEASKPKKKKKGLTRGAHY